MREPTDLPARVAELTEALRELFGTCKNEMVSRGLPVEWQPDSAMGRAERALTGKPEGDEGRMTGAPYLT